MGRPRRLAAPPRRLILTRAHHVALVALAALAAVAPPLAGAGSRDAPEIEDPRDVDATNLDIIAAWLERERGGVRFHIMTVDGSMPERYPGAVYWIEFRAGGVLSSALVGFDTRGNVHGHIGPLDGPEYDRGDISRFANGRVVDIEQERGRPSVWSGLLPWGSVPGLREGAVLIDLRVGSAQYNPTRGWSGAVDVATSDRAFVAAAERGVLDNPLVGALVLATATAVGAAGGWWLLRRQRRADPPRKPA